MSYGVPTITSHAQAKAHWDRVPSLRGSDERPAGQRNLKNRRMRLESDGSVSYLYYGELVCSWHPDGEVTVKAPSCQRHGVFDEYVKPRGIALDIGTRAGSIAYLDSGEPNYRRYNPNESEAERAARPCDGYSIWCARRVDGKPNPNIWVIKAAEPVRLRRQADGYWRPVDVSKLDPFKWDELDRKAAREVSRKAGIPDFVAAMDAIVALNGELPPYDGSYWRGDYDGALALIEAGNFIDALGLLRRDQPRRYISGKGWDYGPERIISTELERLRTRLYLREGVLKQRCHQYLTLPEYIACEGAMKRFKQSQ